jgi:UDP-N-acetylglucosamine acyltransferase
MHRLLYREGRTLADARVAVDALAQQSSEAAQDAALMSGFLAKAERGIAR